MKRKHETALLFYEPFFNQDERGAGEKYVNRMLFFTNELIFLALHEFISH